MKSAIRALFDKVEAEGPVPLKEQPPPKKQAKPQKKQVLAKVEVKPPDLTLRDKPVIEDDGTASDLTFPVQTMTRESYDRELNSAHLGYKAFLKSRNLDALKLALARNSSPKATKFLKLLLNPKYADQDIAVLAEQCNIGFGELMAVWRNDRLTDAMSNFVDAAPVIAQHTAEDAQSTQVCCPRCDGSGQMRINREDVFSWVQCLQCSGTGAVRKIGDRASRQMVFEATGLVKSGAGVSVNINTGAASSVESVLDEMERAGPLAEAIDVQAEVL